VIAWKQAVEQAQDLQALAEQLQTGGMAGVYSSSVQLVQDQLLFMVKEGLEKFLVVVTAKEEVPFAAEVSSCGRFHVFVAELNSANAAALRALLPWTAPQPFGTEGISLGLGDRLGLASPGHIKTVRHSPVRPVLAQQSMRELDLTKRTYRDVLDAATWAVFQEGYSAGYGADGDHLKKVEHIQAALELGFSMITLDCSEHIDDGASSLSEDGVAARYRELPADLREQLEGLYKDKTYRLNSGAEIHMEPAGSERMVLTYYRALDFMEMVYKTVIDKQERSVDFEISIDEVATPTTPQDHFFVAHELQRRGVRASSVAPRFCGQFEKGIDYIGDRAQFEQEFAIHSQIAEHFGYKLSVHSGSDKFSIFPIIGKHAGKRGYHLKTAGTNWLEAVRVIAARDPELYRAMHRKALATVDQARAFYKVSLDLAGVPDLEQVSDGQLPDLLRNNNDVRQLLHITYGFILTDPELREPFFTVLKANEDLYEQFLMDHIGRHLQALGIN